MYELGQYFRRRYGKLLGDGSYSPDKIYTLSSPVNRTINSASLVLNGLFPPNDHQEWNEDLSLQPIPVHVDRNNLIQTYTTCASLKAAQRHHQSVEIQTLLNRHKELFEYLEDHSGEIIPTTTDLYYLYNTFEVELENNITLPDWSRKVFFPGSDMEYLAHHQFKFYTGSPELKKIRAGFLLREILSVFNNKTLSTLSPDRAILLYSGHDTTISSILDSLGLFELFYRSSTAETLTQLNIPNCGTKYTLDQLYYTLKEVLPSEKSIEDFGLPVKCEN